MPVETNSPEAQPTADNVRCLFVVARDHFDLWHYLRRDFATDEGVQVILDRRRGDRRQRYETPEQERRRSDRRRPSIDHDLRYRSFVIIHKQQGLRSA